MTKTNNLKKAPYFNQQAAQCEPFNDWLILIGDNANEAFYRHREAGKGEQWAMIREAYHFPAGYQPCILCKNWQEIDRLQLAPTAQRSIKLFQTGNVPTLAKDGDDVKTRVLMNLAANNPQLVAVEWLDEALQGENLYPLMQSIKAGKDTVAEMLKAKSPQAHTQEQNEAEAEDYEERFNHLGDNGKVAEFLKWYRKPIRRHDSSGEFYQYTGKKWEALEVDALGREIRHFFVAKGIKKYSAVRIKKLIELFNYELEPTAEHNSGLLAFNNGVLNKLTLEFMPHNARYFLTSFIDTDYRETAQDTPHFRKWLEWVSEGSETRAKTILAGLYMVLINADKWQLFIEVTGAGGTGKSTYTEIAKLLAGENNHVGITLKALDDEVKRCIIIDKTFIISGDQEKYAGDGATIRAITGGDDVFFNPKHKKPFSRKVNAVFMTTNNTPILFTENSGGTERRRVIFKFDRVVPIKERDYNLMSKIQAETGGIIRLLFDTFPDSLEAKALLEQQRISKEALAVKMEINPILEFAQEFEIKPTLNGLSMGSNLNPEEKNTAIFPAYHYFCRCNDLEPINRRTFIRAFKQALKELDKGEYQTRKTNGRTITNVYYINRADTFDKWKS